MAFKDGAFDWYGALVVFACASILMIFINGFFFFTFTTTPEQITENADVKSFSLDQASVAQAVKNIEQRDSRAKSVPALVRVDPSL